jgi:hypothetical protein
MTAITVRLSQEDHKLLQLLCIGSGKSQNMLITELLHAEFDRALPGKRELVADGGPDALWRALGVAPPAADPDADAWARVGHQQLV